VFALPVAKHTYSFTTRASAKADSVSDEKDRKTDDRMDLGRDSGRGETSLQ